VEDVKTGREKGGGDDEATDLHDEAVEAGGPGRVAVTIGQSVCLVVQGSCHALCTHSDQ